MSKLILPASRCGPSMVDTPVGRLHRDTHIERLHALADRYDDEAYEASSVGNKRRAAYAGYWEGRTRSLAQYVALEPIRKALDALGARA